MDKLIQLIKTWQERSPGWRWEGCKEDRQKAKDQYASEKGDNTRDLTDMERKKTMNNL